MRDWRVLLVFLLVGCSSGQVHFPGQGGEKQEEKEDADVRLGLLAAALGQHPIGKPLEQNDRTISQPYIVNNPNSGCRCYPGYTCPTTTQRPSYNTDGTGLIDIRIVNRPHGSNKCTNGVLCCYGSSNQGGSYVSGNNYNSGGNTQCGTRNPFQQVSGYSSQYGQAQFGEYPWTAVLLSGGKNYVGAGALLDERHVLTAAHKVQRHRYGLVVRLGEWDAQHNQEPLQHIEREVEVVFIHPDFNSGNLKNDIAVLKLKHPVYYSRHVKPICLPAKSYNFVHSRCWVSGWGKDAFGSHGKYQFVQKEVDVPIISHYDCENRLKGTRLRGAFNLDAKSFICAGGEEGKDACTGDGGAPLVCNYGGRFYVVGLVAWGVGCADSGVPGVYVNVASYLDWIYQHTR